MVKTTVAIRSRQLSQWRPCVLPGFQPSSRDLNDLHVTFSGLLTILTINTDPTSQPTV